MKERLIYITALVVAILALWHGCNKKNIAEKKLAVAEHNINALQDTIRLTKAKDGTPEYNKLAYLVKNVEDLKKLNTDLANKVKNIKGKVTTIISGGIQIVHDTLDLTTTGEVRVDTVYTYFNFNKQYSPGNSRTLEGYTAYNLLDNSNRGQLTKDSLNIAFTTGIKNLDKGKPEIFLTSLYPGFSATKLDGAVLDPKLFQKNKQKLITFGMNVGWTPFTYDFIKQKAEINLGRVGVSAGININLLKLLQ